MTQLKNIILKTVKNNEVQMIPKWKFVLYSSLGVAVTVFLFILLSFVISLVLFVLSQYGFLDIPLFGFVHIMKTLGAVPVPLFISAVVLLFLLEAFTRVYSFSFKRPLILTLLIATGSSLVVSFVITQTPLHEYVRDYARENQIRPVANVYGRPVPLSEEKGALDVIRGKVSDISSSTVLLQLFDGQIIPVRAASTTSMEVLASTTAIGDDIVILGVPKERYFEVVKMKPALRAFFGEPRKKERHDMERSGRFLKEGGSEGPGSHGRSPGF